jgi:hypothetical protein
MSNSKNRRARVELKAHRDNLSPIDAPELTILAALDHILELANFALVAANLELAGEPSLLRPLDPQAALASQVVNRANRLTKAIARYRAATIAAVQSEISDEHVTF